jgi:uncharacterized protein YktA (UPF0223 family)
MNWKVTRINTWWSAEEASNVLSFLDELRDQLWETHGEQITAQRLAELDAQNIDERQAQLKLDNHIDF